MKSKIFLLTSILLFLILLSLGAYSYTVSWSGVSRSADYQCETIRRLCTGSTAGSCSTMANSGTATCSDTNFAGTVTLYNYRYGPIGTSGNAVGNEKCSSYPCYRVWQGSTAPDGIGPYTCSQRVGFAYVICANSYTLSVSKSGSGTVTSSPSGIDCGSTCSYSYISGTSVTLTATPAPGLSFTGWGGACSGTGTCTVTMSSAKSVTATFTPSSTCGVTYGDYSYCCSGSSTSVTDCADNPTSTCYVIQKQISTGTITNLETCDTCEKCSYTTIGGYNLPHCTSGYFGQTCGTGICTPGTATYSLSADGKTCYSSTVSQTSCTQTCSGTHWPPLVCTCIGPITDPNFVDCLVYCNGWSGSCSSCTCPSTTSTQLTVSGPCEYISGCSGTTPGTRSYYSSSTICRASSGTCDTAEYCTGHSGECPSDTSQYAKSRLCWDNNGANDYFCTSSSMDTACCNSYYHCVYNGVCYYSGPNQWSTTAHNVDWSGEADAACMNNGANSYWLDCDYDSIFCSTCDSSTDLPNCVGTGCWINEGETGISFGDYTDGQTECCGDDSGEYLKTQTNYYPSMDQRQVGEYAIDWIGQGTTSACCNSDSDNINYDGQCITSNTQLLAQRVGASYTGHDMYSSPVSWYGWLECDLHGTGYCPNICSSFIKSGETAAHGEYSASDISSGTTECCGDDSGEYNQTFKDYPSSTISWGSSSYKACCDAYDCIDKNSNCKTGYNTFDHFGDVYTNLNSGGNDNIAFCYSGLSSTYTYWLDCDINQRYRNWCNPNCDSWDGTNNRCVLTDGVTIDPDWNSTNSICGRGSGVKAGESNVGEYTDTTTSGCCGDDANEYYKSNANGKYACCNTDSDVLDSNGLCQSFDFSLSNDGNKTITQGESTTNQITVTLVYGTTQQVNLSLKGNLPTGLTYSFSQTSVNPTATSTLTINTLTSTPAGNYLINVTGNSSGIIRSTVFNLTVNIIKYNLTLNKTSGYSYGTITSNPSGIDCGTSCNLAYSEFSSGTLVTLTATPSLGSNFYSWGNSCSGSSLTCAVTMDQAKTVTANFTKCSNSILEQGEQCDDGNSLNTDQCNNSCKLTSCGDSITQSLNGYNQQETCDYGALNQNSCLAPYGGSCEYCNLSCILNTNSSNYLTISLSNNHLNPTTDTYSSNKIIPVNITLFNFAGTLNDYYLANNQIVACNKIGSTYSNQADNTVCNKINNSLSNCTIMLDSLFSTFDVPMNYSGCVNVNNIWYKSNPGYLLINTTCGDGKNVSSKGEQCDDGNQFNTDQCNNSCKYTYCGDLIVQSPNGYNIQEQCETTCTLPSTCYNITHVNKTNALCTNCSCTYSLEYCEEGYECSSGACVPVGAESCITNSDCSDDQSCCYGSTQYRNGSCITNLPNGMNTSSATESDSCLCMLSRMPGKAKNGTCQNSGDYPCWDTQSARCCGNEIGENWSTTTSTNRMLEDILILGYCNNGVWKSREDSGLTYYTLRVD